jgi:hypothetical protein
MQPGRPACKVPIEIKRGRQRAVPRAMENDAVRSAFPALSYVNLFPRFTETVRVPVIDNFGIPKMQTTTDYSFHISVLGYYILYRGVHGYTFLLRSWCGIHIQSKHEEIDV